MKYFIRLCPLTEVWTCEQAYYGSDKTHMRAIIHLLQSICKLQLKLQFYIKQLYLQLKMKQNQNLKKIST